MSGIQVRLTIRLPIAVRINRPCQIAFESPKHASDKADRLP
jgi:hypothetical protein